MSVEVSLIVKSKPCKEVYTESSSHRSYLEVDKHEEHPALENGKTADRFRDVDSLPQYGEEMERNRMREEEAYFFYTEGVLHFRTGIRTLLSPSPTTSHNVIDSFRRRSIPPPDRPRSSLTTREEERDALGTSPTTMRANTCSPSSGTTSSSGKEVTEKEQAENDDAAREMPMPQPTDAAINKMLLLLLGKHHALQHITIHYRLEMEPLSNTETTAEAKEETLQEREDKPLSRPSLSTKDNHHTPSLHPTALSSGNARTPLPNLHTTIPTTMETSPTTTTTTSSSSSSLVSQYVLPASEVCVPCRWACFSSPASFVFSNSFSWRGTKQKDIDKDEEAFNTWQGLDTTTRRRSGKQGRDEVGEDCHLSRVGSAPCVPLTGGIPDTVMRRKTLQRRKRTKKARTSHPAKQQKRSTTSSPPSPPHSILHFPHTFTREAWRCRYWEATHRPAHASFGISPPPPASLLVGSTTPEGNTGPASPCSVVASSVTSFSRGNENVSKEVLKQQEVNERVTKTNIFLLQEEEIEPREKSGWEMAEKKDEPKEEEEEDGGFLLVFGEDDETEAQKPEDAANFLPPSPTTLETPASIQRTNEDGIPFAAPSLRFSFPLVVKKERVKQERITQEEVPTSSVREGFSTRKEEEEEERGRRAITGSTFTSLTKTPLTSPTSPTSPSSSSSPARKLISLKHLFSSSSVLQKKKTLEEAEPHGNTSQEAKQQEEVLEKETLIAPEVVAVKKEKKEEVMPLDVKCTEGNEEASEPKELATPPRSPSTSFFLSNFSFFPPAASKLRSPSAERCNALETEKREKRGEPSAPALMIPITSTTAPVCISVETVFQKLRAHLQTTKDGEEVESTQKTQLFLQQIDVSFVGNPSDLEEIRQRPERTRRIMEGQTSCTPSCGSLGFLSRTWMQLPWWSSLWESDSKSGSPLSPRSIPTSFVGILKGNAMLPCGNEDHDTTTKTPHQTEPECSDKQEPKVEEPLSEMRDAASTRIPIFGVLPGSRDSAMPCSPLPLLKTSSTLDDASVVAFDSCIHSTMGKEHTTEQPPPNEKEKEKEDLWEKESFLTPLCYWGTLSRTSAGSVACRVSGAPMQRIVRRVAAMHPMTTTFSASSLETMPSIPSAPDTCTSTNTTRKMATVSSLLAVDGGEQKESTSWTTSLQLHVWSTLPTPLESLSFIASVLPSSLYTPLTALQKAFLPFIDDHEKESEEGKDDEGEVTKMEKKRKGRQGKQKVVEKHRETKTTETSGMPQEGVGRAVPLIATVEGSFVAEHSSLRRNTAGSFSPPPLSEPTSPFECTPDAFVFSTTPLSHSLRCSIWRALYFPSSHSFITPFPFRAFLPCAPISSDASPSCWEAMGHSTWMFYHSFSTGIEHAMGHTCELYLPFHFAQRKALVKTPMKSLPDPTDTPNEDEVAHQVVEEKRRRRGRPTHSLHHEYHLHHHPVGGHTARGAVLPEMPQRHGSFSSLLPTVAWKIQMGPFCYVCSHIPTNTMPLLEVFDGVLRQLWDAIVLGAHLPAPRHGARRWNREIHMEVGEVPSVSFSYSCLTDETKTRKEGETKKATDEITCGSSFRSNRTPRLVFIVPHLPTRINCRRNDPVSGRIATTLAHVASSYTSTENTYTEVTEQETKEGLSTTREADPCVPCCSGELSEGSSLPSPMEAGGGTRKTSTKVPRGAPRRGEVHARPNARAESGVWITSEGGLGFSLPVLIPLVDTFHPYPLSREAGGVFGERRPRPGSVPLPSSVSSTTENVETQRKENSEPQVVTSLPFLLSPTATRSMVRLCSTLFYYKLCQSWPFSVSSCNVGEEEKEEKEMEEEDSGKEEKVEMEFLQRRTQREKEISLAVIADMLAVRWLQTPHRFRCDPSSSFSGVDSFYSMDCYWLADIPGFLSEERVLVELLSSSSSSISGGIFPLPKRDTEGSVDRAALSCYPSSSLPSIWQVETRKLWLFLLSHPFVSMMLDSILEADDGDDEDDDDAPLMQEPHGGYLTTTPMENARHMVNAPLAMTTKEVEKRETMAQRGTPSSSIKLLGAPTSGRGKVDGNPWTHAEDEKERDASDASWTGEQAWRVRWLQHLFLTSSWTSSTSWHVASTTTESTRRRKREEEEASRPSHSSKSKAGRLPLQRRRHSFGACSSWMTDGPLESLWTPTALVSPVWSKKKPQSKTSPERSLLWREKPITNGSTPLLDLTREAEEQDVFSCIWEHLHAVLSMDKTTRGTSIASFPCSSVWYVVLSHEREALSWKRWWRKQQQRAIAPPRPQTAAFLWWKVPSYFGWPIDEQDVLSRLHGSSTCTVDGVPLTGFSSPFVRLTPSSAISSSLWWGDTSVVPLTASLRMRVITTTTSPSSLPPPVTFSSWPSPAEGMSSEDGRTILQGASVWSSGLHAGGTESSNVPFYHVQLDLTMERRGPSSCASFSSCPTLSLSSSSCASPFPSCISLHAIWLRMELKWSAADCHRFLTSWYETLFPLLVSLEATRKDGEEETTQKQKTGCGEPTNASTTTTNGMTSTSPFPPVSAHFPVPLLGFPLIHIGMDQHHELETTRMTWTRHVQQSHLRTKKKTEEEHTHRHLSRKSFSLGKHKRGEEAASKKGTPDMEEEEVVQVFTYRANMLVPNENYEEKRAVGEGGVHHSTAWSARLRSTRNQENGISSVDSVRYLSDGKPIFGVEDEDVEEAQEQAKEGEEKKDDATHGEENPTPRQGRGRGRGRPVLRPALSSFSSSSSLPFLSGERRWSRRGIHQVEGGTRDTTFGPHLVPSRMQRTRRKGRPRHDAREQRKRTALHWLLTHAVAYEDEKDDAGGVPAGARDWSLWATHAPSFQRRNSLVSQSPRLGRTPLERRRKLEERQTTSKKRRRRRRRRSSSNASSPSREDDDEEEKEDRGVEMKWRLEEPFFQINRGVRGRPRSARLTEEEETDHPTSRTASGLRKAQQRQEKRTLLDPIARAFMALEPPKDVGGSPLQARTELHVGSSSSGLRSSTLDSVPSRTTTTTFSAYPLPGKRKREEEADTTPEDVPLTRRKRREGEEHEEDGGVEEGTAYSAAPFGSLSSKSFSFLIPLFWFSASCTGSVEGTISLPSTTKPIPPNEPHPTEVHDGEETAFSSTSLHHHAPDRFPFVVNGDTSSCELFWECVKGIVEVLAMDLWKALPFFLHARTRVGTNAAVAGAASSSSMKWSTDRLDTSTSPRPSSPPPGSPMWYSSIPQKRILELAGVSIRAVLLQYVVWKVFSYITVQMLVWHPTATEAISSCSSLSSTSQADASWSSVASPSISSRQEGMRGRRCSTASLAPCLVGFTSPSSSWRSAAVGLTLYRQYVWLSRQLQEDLFRLRASDDVRKHEGYKEKWSTIPAYVTREDARQDDENDHAWEAAPGCFTLSSPFPLLPEDGPSSFPFLSTTSSTTATTLHRRLQGRGVLGSGNVPAESQPHWNWLLKTLRDSTLKTAHALNPFLLSLYAPEGEEWMPVSPPSSSSSRGRSSGKQNGSGAYRDWLNGVCRALLRTAEDMGSGTTTPLPTHTATSPPKKTHQEEGKDVVKLSTASTTEHQTTTTTAATTETTATTPHWKNWKHRYRHVISQQTPGSSSSNTPQERHDATRSSGGHGVQGLLSTAFPDGLSLLRYPPGWIKREVFSFLRSSFATEGEEEREDHEEKQKEKKERGLTVPSTAVSSFTASLGGTSSNFASSSTFLFCPSLGHFFKLFFSSAHLAFCNAERNCLLDGLQSCFSQFLHHVVLLDEEEGGTKDGKRGGGHGTPFLRPLSSFPWTSVRNTSVPRRTGVDEEVTTTTGNWNSLSFFFASMEGRENTFPAFWRQVLYTDTRLLLKKRLES